MIGVELLLLLFLAFQDFKDRAISLWVFGALFMVKIVDYIFFALNFNWLAIVSNICYILFIFGGVYLYYFLKYRGEATRRLRDSIGAGDVILIGYFALFFDSLFFIVFIQIGVLLTLLIQLLLKRFIEKKEIAFAGYLAVFYVAIVTSEYLTKRQIIGDEILIKWLKL